MKMYTFKSEFIDGKKNILIPALQRDYVQGGRADVINPFIDELLSALKCEKRLDLNYIYGSYENEDFVPVDGQQRLITLWLVHLYLYKMRGKDFPVNLKFASREFANAFSEKLLAKLQDFKKSKSLKDEIIDASWFVSGWQYDVTVCNMLKTLDLLAKKCNKPNITDYVTYENITFAFLDMKTEGLTDDIYVKMNGRGKALTYFENLKSWMDGKVIELFGEKDKFTKDWQTGMDNQWTDFFWRNRNKKQKHPIVIDEEQTRFFYNLLRIFWIKNGKKGFVREYNRDELCGLLFVESSEELEEGIMSRIGRTKNFTLPLYIIDKLDLFSKDFFTWTYSVLDELCAVAVDINKESIEFDFADSNNSKIYNIFFSSENRQLIIASSIIDFITNIYSGGISGKWTHRFHDWIRFTRNIICNIDDLSDTDNKLMNLMKSMESFVNIIFVNGWDEFLSSINSNPRGFTGISEEGLKEEAKKFSLIRINEEKWRCRIEQLENNKYFTGRIKFIFDFLGNTPKEDKFDKYSEVMRTLFSGDGGNKGSFFSKVINEHLFSRALLCFTTSCGYGYKRDPNLSLLKSSKTDWNTWKKYINDNGYIDFGENQHCRNNDLHELLKEFLKQGVNLKIERDYEKGFESIIENKINSISDYRKFFIVYQEVWDYFETPDKFIRLNNEFDINLVKKYRCGAGVSHAELRSYCLYLDYKNKSLSNDWECNFFEWENTCLYFEKKVKTKGMEETIAIDAYYEVGKKKEDNYTLEIFLRPLEDESENSAKRKSQTYLEKYLDLDNDFRTSKRGYKLRQNCSKADIKKKIKYLIDTI